MTRMRIRRCACSITASTCMRAPVSVTVSKKSQASRTSAWARRNWTQVLDARWGTGSMPASVRICHTGGGDFHAQDEQFAVDAAVAPVRVLLGQAQDQDSDGSYGAWSARGFRTGRAGVTPAERVAVPAQDRIRAHQQAKPAQGLAW